MQCQNVAFSPNQVLYISDFFIFGQWNWRRGQNLSCLKVYTYKYFSPPPPTPTPVITLFPFLRESEVSFLLWMLCSSPLLFVGQEILKNQWKSYFNNSDKNCIASKGKMFVPEILFLAMYRLLKTLHVGGNPLRNLLCISPRL